MARALNCFCPDQLPCAVPSCDFFSWGFVCTDFSSRNCNSASNRGKQLIASGDKQTGGTWVGGMQYIRRHDPISGLAENVRTLAAKPSGDDDLQSGLDTCQADLSDAGYASVAVLASPHEYLIPECRWRALLMFSRKLSLAELQAVARDFDDMKHRSELVPLDSFLLHPDDPLITADLHRQLAQKSETAQKALGNSKNEKWNKSDRRSGSRPGTMSQYSDPVFAMTLPWLDTLTPRELKDLIDSDALSRIVDVGQHGPDRTSLRCENKDVVPCITRGVEFFDKKHHRKVLPAETCMVQGNVLSRTDMGELAPSLQVTLAGLAYNGPLVATLITLMRVAEAKHDAALRQLTPTNTAPAESPPPAPTPVAMPDVAMSDVATHVQPSVSPSMSDTVQWAAGFDNFVI